MKLTVLCLTLAFVACVELSSAERIYYPGRGWIETSAARKTIYKKRAYQEDLYKKPRSGYQSSVSYADDVLEEDSNTSGAVEEGVDEPRYVRPAPRQSRYRAIKQRPAVVSRYTVDDSPLAYERPPVSRRTVRPPARLVAYRPRSRASEPVSESESPKAYSTASATHGTAVSFAHVDGNKAYSTGFASQFPKTPKVAIDRDSRKMNCAPQKRLSQYGNFVWVMVCSDKNRKPQFFRKAIKPIVDNDITEVEQPSTTESVLTTMRSKPTNYKSSSIVYAPNGYDYGRQRPTALRHERGSVGAVDTNDQDSGSDSGYGNDMLYYAESRSNDGDQSSHGPNNQFSADPNADFVILK